MEQKRNRLYGAIAAAGLLVLIFDSRLALESAREGVELCIKTVVPSLFPFFVLSMLLTNSLRGCVSTPVRTIAKFLGIPNTGASVLIPSVLGGYPVGAKCVGDLYKSYLIRKEEAERMLAFCSNAGPSFLFGMISGFFPERKMVWTLWFIHLLSAFLTAAAIPYGKTYEMKMQPEKNGTEKSVILSAATAMLLVCCWVILFRILIAFLNDWFLWILPEWVQVLLMGTLELTNGCCELLRISDVRFRFILCASMLSFGGICVVFQTAAVTKGLSLGSYLKGKILQTLFSLLLSCAVVSEYGLPLAVFTLILTMFFRKIQKRYGNPVSIPV